MKYSLTWDLDSFFEGGSSSPALHEKIISIQTGLNDFETAAKDWDPEHDKPEYPAFLELLHSEEVYAKALMQCNSFITGIQSADVSDLDASAIHARIIQLYSKLTIIQTTLKKKITAINAGDWDLLLGKPDFSPLAFALTEWRQQGGRLLSDKEEALLANLRVDGFNGWSAHYDTLVSFVKIPFEETDGSLSQLSAGQAMNRMYADPDPDVRKRLFVEWEKAWGSLAPAFADTLNHLQGFRLADFEAHQDEDFLAEPLRYNRIKRETLDSMWRAISAYKQPFLSFLDRKAALIGKDKLAWYDVDAPVSLGDFKSKTFSFDEAVDYIIGHFTSFGPKLAAFSLDAVKDRWIEAENRSGKRPGGYCEDYPESKESRIFMTFTGSASDMSTLAHELGHAFHSHVMRDLPDLNTRYAMNVAETASTFAETIISAATVKEASSDEEKIALLNTKLENATAMFLNIHARYIFEKSFYTERMNGFVTADRLSALMEAAQKEAYQDSLSEYHPLFWASKLHFFIDDVPFYNFPYTFGFLFSLGIYAQSMQQSGNFEETYISLLRDTGSMTTEDLVLKHLGADITQLEFWNQGLEIMAEDVAEFLRLTEKYI